MTNFFQIRTILKIKSDYCDQLIEFVDQNDVFEFISQD